MLIVARISETSNAVFRNFSDCDKCDTFEKCKRTVSIQEQKMCTKRFGG